MANRLHQVEFARPIMTSIIQGTPKQAFQDNLKTHADVKNYIVKQKRSLMGSIMNLECQVEILEANI